MSKDEALDLALEALDSMRIVDFSVENLVGWNKAITAIKQARALDKKAENARELGLDYEPADGTQVSKVWWDGEKLMAKPIPLEDIYQPVQKPVGLIDRLTNPEQHYEFTSPKKANAVLMSLCQEAADALAAPVQPMAHIVGEIDHTGKVWKPVQPAPVQPVQEPVACVACEGNPKWGNIPCAVCGTTPPAAPVPQPLGKLCVFDDADSEFGWSYDISGNAEQHRRLKELDGAMLYTTPPAQPSPVQEPVAVVGEDKHGPFVDWLGDRPSFYERNPVGTKFYTTPPAQPAVPDAMTSADIQEHIEYVAGWNDCRAAMLEMMK